MHPSKPIRLALALAAAIALAQDSRGQEPAEFDSGVDIVRLPVAVINPGGGEVPALTIDDFTVYDNEVPQKIQFMLEPTETPLNVALVIDYSPSVQPYQHSMQRAAISFLAGLSGDDCPYVLPFSEQVGPGRWGRYGSEEWERFLREAPIGDGTSLFDALLITLSQLDLAEEISAAYAARTEETPEGEATQEGEATPGDEAAREGDATQEAGGAVQIGRQEATEAEGAASLPQPPPTLLVDHPEVLTREEVTAQLAVILAEIMKTMPPPQLGNCSPLAEAAAPTAASLEAMAKKAILLLSDGSDTTSISTLEDLVAGARLASVPIFPVVLGPATKDAMLMSRLRFLARATGGLLVESERAAGLTAAFQRVFAYAKSYYILGYDPDRIPATEGQGSELTPPEGDPGGKSFGAGAGLPGWHTIRVELRRPLLQVIARPGYYR
jgi:VWFA-related protein